MHWWGFKGLDWAGGGTSVFLLKTFLVIYGYLIISVSIGLP